MHLTRWLSLSLIPLLLTAPASAGTAAEAAKIRQRLKLTSETWELQLKTAPDAEARQKIWQQRPDVKAAALEMWATIRPSLAEDWTLEYDAWLLRVAPSVVEQPGAAPSIDAVNANPRPGAPKSALAEAVNTIRQSVEKQHIKSPKLAPVCLGLVASQDPLSLSLLEKIETQNPDKKVQGTAALGQAMLLKGLGDDPEVMKKRLTLLRKAIIESADVEFDGITVARLAQDELYIIRYLTKGRTAPDLAGTDSGGQPMKLSNFAGKTVVLLFWGTTVPDLDHLLEVTTAMEKKYAGKPVVLLGVNNDPVETLRALQADKHVTWPNFSDPTNTLANEFRVGTRPLAYVLDTKRAIRYFGAPGSFVDLTVDALLTEKN